MADRTKPGPRFPDESVEPRQEREEEMPTGYAVMDIRTGETLEEEHDEEAPQAIPPDQPPRG
jgi:hypothetical protein